MDLFIFGTLLHVPLLEVVSGDAFVGDRLVAATRADHKVSRVEGAVFPMMHPVAGATAHGVIIEGLDDTALARLDYYEKAFGYDRVTFDVVDSADRARHVTAYMPEQGRFTPAESWDCDAWIAEQGALTTVTAREAMEGMDDLSATQMGALYPTIMARAASRMRAQGEPERDGFTQSDVHLHKKRTPYRGFLNMVEMDLSYRHFDGTMSETVNRAVMVGVDCSIVLPYDPVRDRVLLIEQFRPGAYVRGDNNPWTLEPIAGRIDATEDPIDAARRETVEEAGVTLGALHCVSAAYPSPGSSSERFFVYVGEADLPDISAGLGGLDSEHEDIRSHIMFWDDFDKALNGGEFRLLPLVVAGHWLARNRARLRAAN